MENIYLIVSVDTECDKGSKWAIKKPLSFLNVIKGIPDRLEPLFDEFGIKPTFLLSPEVLTDDESTRLFQSLQKKLNWGSICTGSSSSPIRSGTQKELRLFRMIFLLESNFKRFQIRPGYLKRDFVSAPHLLGREGSD
jgi:hypothetical protein